MSTCRIMIADARAVWAATCDVTALAPRPVPKDGLGGVVEREMGGATVVLPYVGHQMLNFTLIEYVIPLG